MKAAVVPALNSPWEIREVPTPEPGPNQVLIKVHASGLCYSDVHFTEGRYPSKFPVVLGHEPAGEVVAVGLGVVSRRVGDRVGVPWVQSSCGRCEWCARRKEFFCPNMVGTSMTAAGSHAEFLVAYADATVLLPETLSYEEAAPLFCAGFTVWSGLRRAEPRPGERVAVVGIGGLGHLAVQYAKAAGFETLAVTQSKDKVEAIRQMGADEVVRDGKALGEAGGADVLLATSNSYRAVGDAMQGLRPDGRVILMGYSEENLPVNGGLIFTRGRVIASTQNEREHLYEALQIAARGGVRVHTETYPLEDAPVAYPRVAEGKARFRVVLTGN